MRKLFSLICCTFFCITSILPAQETTIIPSSELTLKQEKIAPHALVIFGATGDLTKRKLIPALLQLYKKGELPESFISIGIGRRELSNDEYRQQISSFISKEDLPFWQKFSSKFTYLQAPFEDESSYVKISTKLKSFPNRLFYLSTPEANYSPIIKQLGMHGLLKESGDHFSRLVIEKPFGHDSQSAEALRNEIAHYAHDNQVFCIDHYLAKNMVNELVAFRFTNPLIEKVWNHKWIDHVSITLSEDIGIESRGSFWEQTGLLRDVVQNHVMQLLSLAAMEKPKTNSSDDLAAEKTRVLQAIRPFSSVKIPSSIIRGQYAAGSMNGKTLPGYRQEPGVAPNSSVETFMAAKLWIDNERWKDVPFYIKAGKRLAKKGVEICVVFKAPVDQLPIKWVFSIQPNEEISFIIDNEKKTCPLSFKSTSERQEAYEGLFRESMLGKHAHFATVKEIQASWDLWSPVLKYWKDHPPKDFPNYPAGSEGPKFKE